MDTKYSADTKIANSRRQFEMQKANFDMEVNAKVRNCTGNWFLLHYFPTAGMAAFCGLQEHQSKLTVNNIMFSG